MKNLLLILSVAAIAITTGCSTVKKQPLIVDITEITPTQIVVDKEQSFGEKATQTVVNGAVSAVGSIFKSMVASKLGVSMAGHSATLDRNGGGLIIGNAVGAVGSGIDSVVDSSKLGPGQEIVDGVAVTIRLSDGRILSTKFPGKASEYKIGPAEMEIDGHTAKLKPNNLPPSVNN